MTDTTANRPLRVFLCHASNDKPAVRDLYQRLRADGFAPWLDEENLLAGQDWQYEIPNAVRAADAVVVCLSRDSINKEGYVQKEIRVALDVADEKPDGTIFLIPVRLEDCDVPERLSRWQWVNQFETNGYARLTRSLWARMDKLGLTPMFPGMIWLSTASNHRVIGGLEYVRVPKGHFLMGSTPRSSMGHSDEYPQHVVDIPYDYWVGRYPITKEQFARFVTDTKYEFSLGQWQTKADYPVHVSWHDAMAYCRWLNDVLRGDLNDLVLRLPSEAEWEKAARGTQGNEWPWGNEWKQNMCGTTVSVIPIGAYSPRGDSPYGASDMAGNAQEWCHSLYKPYPYDASDGREDETSGDPRVIRGGPRLDLMRNARCAVRFDAQAQSRFGGFRCVAAPALGVTRRVDP